MRFPSALKTGWGWLCRHVVAPLELSNRAMISYRPSPPRVSQTNTPHSPGLPPNLSSVPSCTKSFPSGLAAVFAGVPVHAVCGTRGGGGHAAGKLVLRGDTAFGERREVCHIHAPVLVAHVMISDRLPVHRPLLAGDAVGVFGGDAFGDD